MRVAVLVAIVLAPLLRGGPAAAGDVTVTFDDLSAGTYVTTQYADFGGPGAGVVFGVGPAGPSGVTPLVVDVSPGTTSSGTQAVTIQNPAPPEFPSYGIWGRFPAGGKHLVRCNIGAPAGHPTRTVVLVGVDAAGNDLPGVSQTVTVIADGTYTTPMIIFDALGRIAFFKIVEQGQQNPGLRYDFAGHRIDDLTFDVPDVAPTPDFALFLDLGATAGFPLTVSQGSTTGVGARVVVNRIGGSAGPLIFSTNGLPAGVKANVIATPAGDPTLLTVRLTAASTAPVVNATFDLVANPSGPAVGPAPRSVTIPYAVVADYDLAVSGIDVTQGIQKSQSLPPRPAAPGAGVPYAGVPLVRGKKTMVRVFAVVGAPAGAKVSGATIRLHGRTATGGTLPGSPLTRTIGTLTNGNPNQVSVSALQTGMPATFTLPASWTTAGTIELEAEVSPPLVLFGGATECCPDNDRYRLTNVSFTDTGTVLVHGIWLRGDGQPVIGFPDEFLDGVAHVLPLADGHLKSQGDFSAVMNITPVLAGTTYGDLNPKGCAFGGFCNLPFDPDKVYMSYIEDYETGNAFCSKYDLPPKDQNCPDSVMGFVDDPRVAGLSRGKAVFGWARNVTNVRRPLTSVGHELVHGLGRKHASGGCGGADNGQEADGWPDAFGGLQGIGLDVRDGRVLAPGSAATNKPDTGAPPGTWFDLMSYCANVSGEYGAHSGPDPDGSGPKLSPAHPFPLQLWDTWISSVNWNRVYGDLLVLRDLKFLTAARAAARLAGEGAYGLSVRAFLDGEHVIVWRVAPAPVRIPVPVDSPATLEVRDGAGGMIAAVPMTIESSEGHGGIAVFLDADVPLAGAGDGVLPADLQSAAIVIGGRTEAVVERSANAPVVELRRVPRRLGRRQSFTVRWRASDADGDRTNASIDLSADDGVNWRTIYQGPDTGRVKLPSRLLIPSAAARLRVRVSDGFDESAVTSEAFTVVPLRPVVRITSPAPRAEFAADDVVYLAAVARDGDGADLADDVQWLDGRRVVATGTPASLMGLKPGRHKIRARVRGASGRQAQAKVKIRVAREPATPPEPPPTTTTTLPAVCTADSECDDGDRCNIDVCDRGVCSHVAVGCALHPCLDDAFCDPETGECVEVPKECGTGVCDIGAGGCAP